MLGLSGKVAIVTGGGSGLGREFCVELAKEGTRVVAADVDFSGAEETIRLVDKEGGEGFALCFLASEEADFMHGHTIPVDGGSIIR